MATDTFEFESTPKVVLHVRPLSGELLRAL